MAGGVNYEKASFNRATQAFAPAGLFLQDLRLPDRARKRLGTRRYAGRFSDYDRQLETGKL